MTQRWSFSPGAHIRVKQEKMARPTGFERVTFAFGGHPTLLRAVCSAHGSVKSSKSVPQSESLRAEIHRFASQGWSSTAAVSRAKTRTTAALALALATHDHIRPYRSAPPTPTPPCAGVRACAGCRRDPDGQQRSGRQPAGREPPATRRREDAEIIPPPHDAPAFEGHPAGRCGGGSRRLCRQTKYGRSSRSRRSPRAEATSRRACRFCPECPA
jgi:hypothetical protein